ncbi:MAG: glycosyltransferase [Pseudomonadota bacterium]|nr:glycosyltransferase [Pseudomonadota bacterium]
MKIIHVPYTYFPDAAGGTEIYVEGLAKRLQQSGIESVVCAPGLKSECYLHAGLKIRRFVGRTVERSLEYLYGEGDQGAAQGFSSVLDEERPDLVHIHAFSPAVSLRLAIQVKARGIPLVFTYHTPAATCQRSTLLRWGQTKCNGTLEAGKCASCVLHGRGVPKALATVVGHLPPTVGRFLKSHDLAGGMWTALRMSELVARKHAIVRAFLATPDAVVAPSEWVRNLLLANSVPQDKIFLCPQGVAHVTASCLPPTQSLTSRRALRVIALSRLDVTKGLDVLVKALALYCDFDVTLDIYARAESAGANPYGEALRHMVARDPRVRLLPAIPNEQVLATIARYDVLAAPSQGLETGPLVVLEAFSAGTPVIGSNLGGIAERVTHEMDGLLVLHSDSRAWARALNRLATENGLLDRLRRGVSPPPDIERVSVFMKDLYSRSSSAPLNTKASQMRPSPKRSVKAGRHPAATAGEELVPT